MTDAVTVAEVEPCRRRGTPTQSGGAAAGDGVRIVVALDGDDVGVSFGLLALITAAGLAGPLLAGLPRLGLPLVVGEIAAGVLLGRTGLGWIDPGEPTTAFLGEVDADVRRGYPPAAA